MIRYKCTKCSALLETDDVYAGKVDRCPICSYKQVVPIPRRMRRKEKRRQPTSSHALVLSRKPSNVLARRTDQGLQLAIELKNDLERLRQLGVNLDTAATMA